jgi:hypothetical protein
MLHSSLPTEIVMSETLTESRPASLSSATKLLIAILGTPEHEGRMCGRAFEILGVNPIYIHPSNPVLPSNPVPDAVLLTREWSIDIRHATIEARRQGIPVIYLMDGVIEWDYFWHNWGFIKPEGTVLQPLIASDLCVIGQHPARILAALGLAKRIHIVGLPRLDGLGRRRVIDRDLPQQIVIATAQTFGHNTAHKVYVRAALRDLKNWFDGHRELTPVWRITEESAAELGVIGASAGTIADALETANSVISFTSTVLLESMRLGIPTALVDYRAVPQYVQTAWEIRNPEQIESVVQELLYPPAEKLAYQELCLNDELESRDASERLAEVIRLSVESKPEEETGAPARVHGLVDFRQVNSHLSAFSVAPLSRLQYELDATYKLWERDRKRLKENSRQFDAAKLQAELLAELRIDPVARAIVSLGWLPGLRRMARLIQSLLAVH